MSVLVMPIKLLNLVKFYITPNVDRNAHNILYLIGSVTPKYFKAVTYFITVKVKCSLRLNHILVFLKLTFVVAWLKYKWKTPKAIKTVVDQTNVKNIIT